MIFSLKSLIIIVTATISVVDWQFSQAQQIEQILINALFKNYTRTIRPDVTVDVAISVQLKQIISLDEKNQMLTTTSFISQTWYDTRLSWDRYNYNDTEVIMVSLKNIWLPDTMIINTASGDGYLKLNADFGYCSVFYDGFVNYISPAIALQTRCSLDMSSYPFDFQSCSIRLASWAMGDNKIKYSVNDSVLDISDYTENSIWDLFSSNIKTSVKGDRSLFEQTQSTEIVIELNLERKPLYYMINSIFPCFILNIVTLVSFFMPLANAMTICKYRI